MNIKQILQKKEHIFFITVCAIILIIKTYIIYSAFIPTGSMENTLPTKSKVIGNRLAYINNSPERGDIIIFNSSLGNVPYVKRIIGLPGEKIEIKDSKIYINDELLEENYLKEEWTIYNTGFIYNVPEDCYFVLGDNRNNSCDARYWKNEAIKQGYDNPEQYSFVHKNTIKAKAVLLCYPKIKIL